MKLLTDLTIITTIVELLTRNNEAIVQAANLVNDTERAGANDVKRLKLGVHELNRGIGRWRFSL